MSIESIVVIGLDLAGSPRRPTGFCILYHPSLDAYTSIIYTDEEIVEAIAGCKPRVVAIDAPLGLPRGRRSMEEHGPHLRLCDIMLRRAGIRFLPVTLGAMRMLTERGMKLKSIIEGLGFEVIEVYPGGAQDILGLPRAKKDRYNLRSGLEKLGLKIHGVDPTVHELDAATAAYTGLMYVRGDYTALGDPDESIIIMPKASSRV